MSRPRELFEGSSELILCFDAGHKVGASFVVVKKSNNIKFIAEKYERLA